MIVLITSNRIVHLAVCLCVCVCLEREKMVRGNKKIIGRQETTLLFHVTTSTRFGQPSGQDKNA